MIQTPQASTQCDRIFFFSAVAEKKSSWKNQPEAKLRQTYFRLSVSASF
jgi:hypothetical protein